MDANFSSGYAGQKRGYHAYSKDLDGQQDGQEVSPSTAEVDSLSRSPYFAHLRHQSAPESYGNSLPQSWPTTDFGFGIPLEPIDAADIQKFLRSTHEAPWSGPVFQSAGVPSFQANLQALPPGGYSSKAYTVAGGAESSHLRPQNSGKLSFAGTNDSGFESAYPKHASSLPNSFKIPDKPNDRFSAASQHASHPTSVLPNRAASVKSDSYLQIPQTYTKRKKARTVVSPCKICGKEPKNQSDADKHEYTHTRPFRCSEPGCSRAEGFATRNDLERHRKSIHSIIPIVGEKEGYVCRACPDSGPGISRKWWPRNDNFRAHIRRKHLGCNEEALVQSSKCLKPDDALSESGYASQPPQSQAPEEQDYQQEFSSPLYASGMYPDFDQSSFDMYVGMGGGASNDTFATDRDTASHHHEPTPEGPYGGLHFGAPPSIQTSSPKDPMMKSPLGHHPDASGDTFDQYAFGVEQKTRFSRVLWDDMNKRRNVSSNDDEHIHVKTEDGQYLCPHCGKTKKRECDLRKHLKRHTRPYGCTFAQCNKRFGSRNDWKRHENTQHRLNEMWKCGIEWKEGFKCGKLTNQEQDFASHLQRRHGFALESAENRAHRKSMHLGREGHHRFWCGFCNCLVDQEDGSQPSAWEARAKHIGDHFDKEGDHINDWVDIEENKKKRLITKDDRRRAKERAQSGRVDNDSDLGEDGIPSFLPGYTAPVHHVPAGYDPGMSAPASVYTLNERGLEEGEMDPRSMSDARW